MKLTKDNYYSIEANRQYMSVSQFKGFLPSYGGCEARAMAELAGDYVRPQKDAFDEGHYLHSWNEGTLDEFKANNPDLYSSRGQTKGQLKSNFQHCNEMIKVLANDPRVMQALAGEKEVILTAELFGILWKVMLDSYQPNIGNTGIFADLKCMKEIEGKFWNREQQIYENFIDHYGYGIQMAIYAEIERRAVGRENSLIPHMVIVTKEDPPDHEILWFDYDYLDQQLLIVERHIERVKAVKGGLIRAVRCERCDYCRATKQIKQIKHFAELALY